MALRRSWRGGLHGLGFGSELVDMTLTAAAITEKTNALNFTKLKRFVCQRTQ